MGWTWALWYCQQVMLRAEPSASLVPQARVEDYAEVGPVSDGKHLSYVDNFAAFATSASSAQSCVDAMVSALRKAGLVVTCEPASGDLVKVLGWHIEGDSSARLRRIGIYE